MVAEPPPRPHTAYWRERAMRGHTNTYIYTHSDSSTDDMTWETRPKSGKPSAMWPSAIWLDRMIQ